MPKLEPDCEEILTRMRNKLEAGQREHGLLDVMKRTDNQDNEAGIEELLDLSAYMLMKVIRWQRQDKNHPLQSYGKPGDVVIHRAMSLVAQYHEGGPLRLLDSDLEYLSEAVTEMCTTCG